MQEIRTILCRSLTMVPLISMMTFADEMTDSGASPFAGVADTEQVAVADPAWNKWEIGPEVFMYEYNEPGLMVGLNGVLYGIGGRFDRYMPRIRQVTIGRGEDAVVTEREYLLMLRVDGRYAQGEHDYDGSLQDGTPITLDGIDATSYEFRTMVGYSAQVHQDRMTAFYAGLGMRFKDDDSSFHPSGYKRESSYKYVPFLVEHTRTLINGSSLSFALEYDFFIAGEQITDFSVIEIKNKQESGSGWRASVAYAGTTTAGIGWKIEPFVRCWDIDDSEIVSIRDGYYIYSFLEPKNDTLELGVNVRVLF